MSSNAVVVISDLITLILSWGGLLFLSGRSWGEVKRDIDVIKRDLAKIEGMFVLRLRDESTRDRQ